MYLIYFIYNTITDCVYVGQTKEHATRLRRHKYHLMKGNHHSDYLQRAWSKYGEAAFSFYPVYEADSLANADEVERAYISWFRALGLSYNMDAGGRQGGEITPETREKIAAAARGNQHQLGLKRSDETKQKQRERKLGKHQSPEHVAKCTLAKIGQKRSEETCKKIAEANKGNQNFLGRHHSEETKQAMSEARKGEGNPAYGKPQSEESNRKRSEATKGRPGKPLSEETKQKIREARAKQTLREKAQLTEEIIQQRLLHRVAKKREYAAAAKKRSST
jgi:hypothetical protein